MSYELKDSERTTAVMAYTPLRLAWGNLVHPESVRPQTWLKNSIVPEFLTLLEAEMLLFGGAQPVRQSIGEMYVPVPQILAIHLLPPADYERDYDETEPNRTMKEVTVSFDLFRLDGLCRIATIADFSASIRSFREPFRPFYAATLSHPTAPALKPLFVPYVLVRSSAIQYMVQHEA